MVDRLTPVIEFRFAGNSSSDCNRAVIFCKAWEIFAIADFEHNIANRMTSSDVIQSRDGADRNGRNVAQQQSRDAGAPASCMKIIFGS